MINVQVGSKKLLTHTKTPKSVQVSPKKTPHLYQNSRKRASDHFLKGSLARLSLLVEAKVFFLKMFGTAHRVKVANQLLNLFAVVTETWWKS